MRLGGLARISNLVTFLPCLHKQNRAARAFQAFHGVSERRGCQALGVDRSSVRYVSHKPDQAPLRRRIHDLAAMRMRYGYFRIYILSRREGWLVNHKCVYRLYGCGR